MIRMTGDQWRPSRARIHTHYNHCRMSCEGRMDGRMEERTADDDGIIRPAVGRAEGFSAQTAPQSALVQKKHFYSSMYIT